MVVPLWIGGRGGPMLRSTLLSIVRPGEGAIKVATRGTKERNARRSNGPCNIIATRLLDWLIQDEKWEVVCGLFCVLCFVVRRDIFWILDLFLFACVKFVSFFFALVLLSTFFTLVHRLTPYARTSFNPTPDNRQPPMHSSKELLVASSFYSSFSISPLVSFFSEREC